MIEHFLPGSSYTVELGEKLKNYVDLTVLCKKDSGSLGEADYIKKILLEKKSNKIMTGLDYAFSFIRVFKEILRGKYDVIHIQTDKRIRYETIFYNIIKKLFHPLMVNTVHNVIPHEERNNTVKLYEKFYSVFDVFIAHNQTTANILSRDFNISKEKICIIPHGAYSKEPLNKQFKKNKEMCTYLTFGAIKKYKGVDILLKAISLLSDEERKNKHFIIAGKHDKLNDKTDYLKMIDELNISDCVKLIDRRIEESELPELFSKADVCVFPYRKIYGSGALLMAYTFKKPVIAANVPTFIEETENGKTGLLFDSENSKALAEKIVEFAELDENKYNEFTKNITRLVNEKYNWELSAKKTAEIYSEFLK